MRIRPINIIEIITALLFITAHFLKGELPYMGLASVLGGMTLCALYFYLGMYTLKSLEIKTIYLIIYGLVFGTAIIGMIFSFQIWPYGNFFMLLGITLLLLLALIRAAAVYLFNKPQILLYNRAIIVRYITIFIFSIYAFLTYKF